MKNLTLNLFLFLNKIIDKYICILFILFLFYIIGDDYFYCYCSKNNKLIDFNIDPIIKINERIKRTVILDSNTKNIFPIINGCLPIGPSIVITKQDLTMSNTNYNTFLLMRRILKNLYRSSYGIILASKFSKVENIRIFAIDTSGQFRPIDIIQSNSKKIDGLNKKWLKKRKIPTSKATLKDLGIDHNYSSIKKEENLISEGSNGLSLNINGMDLINNEERKKPVSLIQIRTLKNNKFKKMLNIHMITIPSRIKEDLILCKCSIKPIDHKRLLELAQTLQFSIINGININNIIWFNLPKMIRLLLLDIMRNSSIIRAMSPLFKLYNNTEEYFNIAKYYSTEQQKQYYKNYFSDIRNSYKNKLLIEFLSETIGLFGNFFQELISNDNIQDILEEIEISSIEKSLLINNNIDTYTFDDKYQVLNSILLDLPANNNCILSSIEIFKEASEASYKSFFSLC
ncbi:uncharacterized protein CMU_009730 [Cryptosporidium muris RN66]|uniref:Uncharacterized protein n=1 Tax=Cryptosporidium muris (strain RN66) TaxID=441375 RepID=B6AE40_CRYMR|nr:uncharacterized protein CMU_009730 [Cryptosporidium muris RN66]EEA06481.1 hypothetical protein, conserved [Cryptosporidium muris RN66]|eukprot:XP_002140830.1 hypothetical protein [Cryptosporidium muris RN66]